VELGRRGKSKAQMAAALGVSTEALRRWEKMFTEFREAMELATTFAQAWWERQGQLGISDPKFDSGTYARIMQSRFRADYRERQETLHRVDASDTFLKCVQLISAGANLEERN
jgi:hypothetical protein